MIIRVQAANDRSFIISAAKHEGEKLTISDEDIEQDAMAIAYTLSDKLPADTLREVYKEIGHILNIRGSFSDDPRVIKMKKAAEGRELT